MIATYIQELLATNNRVIVPNFGAFLVRATSKSKDANTLEEKLKDIYFSPFLKFNDELLEKYIIKKENISKEQAAEKIKEFIESIKNELDKEKPFEIKDFGKFIVDKQGKVQFITIAKEKETESPKEEKKPAPTPEKEAPKTAKTNAKKTAAPKETKKAPEEPKKEEVKKEEPKKESKLEEFKPEKEEPAKPKTQKPEPKVASYKKKKEPLNKGLVWAIAIGVPVAVLFIFALINIDKIGTIFSKDTTKEKTEITQKKKTDTPKKATANKDDEKPKAEQKSTEQAKTETDKKATQAKQEAKPATPAQKKYYIIAGSFKNEKYAFSYLENLKEQGYKAEKLEERNGMHAVSYNSFTDKRKALAEYRYLTQEKDLQAWILYY